jgi:hypothetical protein
MKTNKSLLSSCVLSSRLLAMLCVAAALLGGWSLNAQTITVTNIWSISTAEGRTYVSINSGELERGVAYNPLTGHAYIVSRSNTLQVAVVDAQTGAHVGNLSVGGISGGDFILSQIGVADDGAIYAANLTTSSTARSFRLYRWADEASVPTLVYAGSPSGTQPLRFGDAIDIRGSGTNTEVIASTGGTAATNLVAVFRATNDPVTGFAVKAILLPTLGLADCAKGITFGPTNSFFGKNTGTATTRHCSYDYDAGTGTVLRTLSLVSTICAIDYDRDNNLIGGVSTANATSPHALIVYDLSGVSPLVIYSNAFPAPATANANLVGGINIYSNHVIAVDSKNGVRMAGINVNTNPVPPSITQQPGSQTIVEGGYSVLTVGATGTKPLAYQWKKNGSDIPNETNVSLLLTNVTLASAGDYSAVVTNIAGATNSSTAAVTISPAVLSTVATKMWQVPGVTNHPWIAADNNSRGIAYNPANNTVIVCSRSAGNNIYVLDADTGMFLRQLTWPGTNAAVGTFALNLVGCADDGRIFAANLTTDAVGTPFKIYMWPSDASDETPRVVYSGSPSGLSGERWGDSFDVSGGGISNPDLRIIAGARNGTNVFLITDAGFGTYDSRYLFRALGADPGTFGLSIALGEGNTFWGKSGGTAIRQYTYYTDSLEVGAGKVLTNYSSLYLIGYDVGHQWIGGIAGQTPDNVRLIDVSRETPVDLDTDMFPTDNANVNGTGAVKFGFERMFALDSNCGLIGFRLAPVLQKSLSGSTLTLTWPGNHTLQASGEVTGGFTNVTTTSGYTFDISSAPKTFFRLLQ